MQKNTISLRSTVVLILLILFTQVGFSQTTSKNSNHKGWRDLTWERTEDDVRRKYGNQLTTLVTPAKYGEKHELYCPFEIENYILSYDTFKVSFLFEVKTKKLTQVNVQKDNPIDIKQSVKDLEINLTEKYGKPIVKEDTPRYISKWFFSDLNIDLCYTDLKVGDVQIMKTIFLSYRKPNKDKLDNF